MHDNEKELSQEESLMIIQQMINAAKHEQKDDGKGWIAWGWMLFIASILTVVNLHFKWFSTFFFWNIFGAVTLVMMIVGVVKGFFVKSKGRVKTYTKSLFEKLNAGFFICIMFNIFAMNLGVGPAKGFALLIGLYGFWILIYGTALDFRPSVIASFITWTFGFIALFQTDFEVVMLLHAAAVLFGYIIPGYIANREFKKLTGRKLNQSAGV
ncbi:hypothetical protein [Segetibacter sp.]|uniref:hypothetical protein n=1 Tax=Segetibacter sp. TaxID=2231182 RepID=UPI00260975CE|nr:hypothetical protein [Segetibacter sp.]MCW3079635.1 hypothetical protein [Segetibacter sp.]